MDMIAASIPGDPFLTIDDCEISRQGVSYTIDTLKDIIARYNPGGKPGLILGDDLASTFYKWRNPGEIAEHADIIIARRLPGEQGECPGEEFACATAENRPGGFPYPCKALDNEILDVSSRLVREKIRRGGAWRYLVPSGARRIIEDRGLYGSSEEMPERGLMETIARVENDIRAILNPERFAHSRNTALMTWDLCRRFNLDSQKGYLAGIAHDMCKEMSTDELFRLAHVDGGNLTRLERKKPGLLHARAAAVQAKKKYGINDRDILEAIRYHTTGTRDMGSLAKAVYIADKIEISRTEAAGLRLMSRTAGLDDLFTAVLDNTVAYLKSRHLDISYGTRRLLAAMNKRNT
jgi:nicotinate-nucleotide adenylyltransferase